ncbi:MAG: TolC family protein [Rikenellaceae bacterium]|nr:TolC family protein [Rikenellaceae bacterium]
MKKILFLTFLFVLLPCMTISAQDYVWTLEDCIEYARVNNLQVRYSRLSEETAETNLLQAEADKLPSLSFSTTQSYSGQKAQNSSGNYRHDESYTGSYSLNAGMTLFNGGKIVNTIRQQELSVGMNILNTEEIQNNIEIAVTQAYLQVLYSNESLKIAEQNLESSEAQLERSEVLFEAGYIALSEVAQIRAQYSGDKYQVTVAENSLADSYLQLRQLLEMGLGERIEIFIPEIDDQEVIQVVPSLESVYATALNVMPEVKNRMLGLEYAELNEKLAYADRLPTVSLSAGLGTSNFSGSGLSFTDQLNRRLNESVGVSISVPIFNNRRAKTSMELAKIQTRSAELDFYSTRKDLLNTVESLYREVVSAQSRYVSALENLRYSTISYTLVEEQYNAGLKNPVELLTEKNNYLAAQQETIQAKYQAVLYLKLLNFYRNEPIRL